MKPNQIRHGILLLWTLLMILGTTTPAPAAPAPERGTLQTVAPAHADFHFAGPLGRRIQADLDQWLLIAPDANPGMIEMFRVRDRQPAPSLVPWAGEFVGKYLISAIQARAMVQDPRLDATIRRVIAQLIATQADDGYLGPFPQKDRLLGNWDLWGTYHVIYALTLWYEQTGDKAALACAQRAGDLICRIYLKTNRRVADAGSTEMNMAIIHGLARLYRLSGEQRYLDLALQIVQEWETNGDYFRAGLNGTPFFQTGRPRWESLHDLQGLVELYRVTGDTRYRDSFMRLWHSIRERDRHPSGAFSAGEQANGTPYADGAIETCCVVAWMTITADMLHLTGDPTVADELELSTWNAALGAQHPSGRWWTYNTPINGMREASAHTIVFQSRYGTPELNCCSVNAPRSIGLLGDWAVTTDQAGVFVNFYGPSRLGLTLADGTPLTITQETQYPAAGVIKLKLALEKSTRFNLRLRIPAWSQTSELTLNGKATPATPAAGTYAAIERTWENGDELTLTLDTRLRTWTGHQGRRGTATLFTGPLLLAFDQHDNTQDTTNLPTFDLANLNLTAAPAADTADPFAPLVSFTAQAQGAAAPVTLRDFAGAGSHGTYYASWLPAVNTLPSPNWRLAPRRDQAVAAGPVLFEWSAVADATKFRLLVARDVAFNQIVADEVATDARRHVIEKGLEPGTTYYWKVIASNARGAAESVGTPWVFTLDPKQPNTVKAQLEKIRLATSGRGPQQILVSSEIIDGKFESAAQVDPKAQWQAAPDAQGRAGHAVEFAGKPEGALRFSLPAFPPSDYTFICWFKPADLQRKELQHICSAWTRPYDDPLRLTIEKGQLSARIEAGSCYATGPAQLTAGVWQQAVVVKLGATLTLYLNGKKISTVTVPESLSTDASVLALGANPSPVYQEAFVGSIAAARLLAKPLTAEEAAACYTAESTGK